MFRTVALATTALALSLAAAAAQESHSGTKAEPPAALDLEKQQQNESDLPSIAEEAAESGAATSGPDEEEKNMDEMEDAEDQDGCTPDDDPAVCDGELLD